MKTGAENRNKTIAAGVLGTGAVLCVVYLLTQMFGGGSSTPPPSVTPTNQPTRISGAIQQNNAAARATGSAAPRGQNGAAPATGPTLIAGVDAEKLATTSSSLDPTLHQDDMLRAEHLAYSGSGRNIFSASYPPPPQPMKIPDPISSVRHVVAPPPPAPYVAPTCPPSCPPINLKFFGVATYKNGERKALLLSGEDVLTALAGDIVARKYKIVSIAPNSLQVQDLVNNNTQTLPLSVN